MIKCKNGNCPKEKEVCCFECDEFESCDGSCDGKPNECGDAEFEGSTDLEVFHSKAAATIKAITDIVTAKKSLEEQENIMKEKLQLAMEQHGVKSFDNEVIKVTYMNESVRNSIDSAKLKKKYPEIAAECNKTSNVKAFIKIVVKEEK